MSATAILLATLTVALDGTGDFKSVQEAVMAATNNMAIHIKPGVYKELIYVQREKYGLRFVGEDAEKTILTFDLHANLPGTDGKLIGTFRTASTVIDADNFSAENLTFENSSGTNGQALAIRLDGDQGLFRNCRFVGWQDTVFANRGRHRFEDCYITGHVDFIFGGATVSFENCHIHCRANGYITAASTPAESPVGFVFSNCKITGEPGVKTYLGRPWRDFAAVTWLNTEMSDVVRPEGWHNWNKPEREATARFVESGSTGPGARPEARVKWARQSVVNNAPPASGVQTDLEYGRAGDERLLLDAHRPDGAGPFPVAIVVHGGGWNGGDKQRDHTRILEALTAAKFVWFAINYRLAPKHQWPACLEDVETAIRWVKAHAADFGGDPRRIALIGYSAGGQLAFAAAMRATSDTRVQAVVGLAPPTDFVADTERRGGLSRSLQDLLGRESADADLLRTISPINYIAPGLPPFLLVHGTADQTVPVTQSQNFIRKLQEATGQGELRLIEAAPHRLTEWDKFEPKYAETVVAWLAHTLDRQRPVRIALVGDSTVNAGSGWGPGFEACLTGGIECTNLAKNGRSSKSYIAEDWWKQCLELKPNYVLIQFGHNDQPGKGLDRETDPQTTYRLFMTQYVDEARAAGAVPVLVTSLSRRQWGEDGRIRSTLVTNVNVVKEIAAAKNVPLIDLHARSIELYKHLGKEGCRALSPPKGETIDNTHLNDTGSELVGPIVAMELKRVVPALAGSITNIFDVRRFATVQETIDECKRAGGGIVRIPAGTHRSRPLTLCSDLTLRLEDGATLQATDDREDFVKGDGFIPFIGGNKLRNVTITGRGTIDGSGAKWWEPAEEARRITPGYTLPRPNLIQLTGVQNLRVENVTIQNSPKFHLVPTDCEDVIISNVTVLAPVHAPNTDAIDPSRCRNVLITKCLIDVGDDNIAIKASRKVEGREFASENITITDCLFRNGHGLSIGSDTAGGVRNVTVLNCTFDGTENGLRIKSRPGRGGVVENIFYSDITMTNVDPAITLSCAYPGTSARDPVQGVFVRTAADTNAVPVYRNIRIQNLIAVTDRSAGLIEGLPDSVISNVVLENVRISAGTTGLKIRHATGVKMENVEITPKEGPPIITEDSQ